MSEVFGTPDPGVVGEEQATDEELAALQADTIGFTAIPGLAATNVRDALIEISRVGVLDYVENDENFLNNGTFASPIDVTEMSLDFTAPTARPYILLLHIPVLSTTSGAPASMGVYFTALDDVPLHHTTWQSTTASAAHSVTFLKYFAPSSGTKNYKARCYSASGDSFTFAGATTPFFFLALGL